MAHNPPNSSSGSSDAVFWTQVSDMNFMHIHTNKYSTHTLKIDFFLKEPLTCIFMHLYSLIYWIQTLNPDPKYERNGPGILL